MLKSVAALSWTCVAGMTYCQTQFLCGGDVSEIPEVEASGAHYSYHGMTEDPFAIMKQAGWNFVRFRVWNSPKAGYCDKAHTLEMAKRAAAQGLKISIDFHYSDWWADPGKQYAPSAWKDLSFDDAVKALHDYTADVIGALVAQGTPPIMVQVGNEITSGLCWPFAKLNGDDPQPWKNLGALLKAGIQGVHDVQGDNKILTMIHLDRGGDNKGAVWWFDHITKEQVPFDLIGLSYYPFWHGTLAAMKENVDDLSRRYGKDIYIVETAYPWTTNTGGVFDAKGSLLPGYPATPDGQARFLEAVIKTVKEVPDGHGRGLLYWAPTWISGPKAKQPWNNNATFDLNGEALPAVDVLGGKSAESK